VNKRSLDELQHSLEHFQPLQGNIESCFADGGLHMEKLVEISQNIIGEVESLLSMAIGKDQGQQEINEAIKTVQDPLEYLQSYGNKIHLHIESLDYYDGMLAPLALLEKDMETTFAPLKFIQTLFKVESAALPEENQAIFITLTEQIDELHTQVNELFNVKFKSLKGVQSTVQNIEERLTTQVTQQLNEASEKRKHIQKSIADLERELKQNSQRETSLHQVSDEMKHHVNRLVDAMQTQDISGQKLTHVFDGLSQALQHQQQGSFSDMRVMSKLKALAHNSALQVAHIRAISKEFHEAQNTIIGVSEDIFRSIKMLDEECLSLSDFKVLTTAADGVVQTLINSIDEVTLLVLAAAEEAESAYQAIKPLEGMTSDMTYVMRDLAISLRIVALNAQIQAAKLGSGTGLEVLAANVGRIADEAEELSNRAGTELDQLSEGFMSLVQQFASIREEGKNQGEKLIDKGEARKSQLHAFRDKALKVMLTVGNQVKSMEEETRALQKNFNGMRKQTQELEELAQTLQNIHDLTSTHAGDWKKHAATSSANLRNQYTMESERAVHDSILGKNNGFTSNVSITRRLDDKDIEFFDNVIEQAHPTSPPPFTPPPQPDEGTQETDNQGFFEIDGNSYLDDSLKIDPRQAPPNKPNPEEEPQKPKREDLDSLQDDNIEFF